MRDSNSKAFSSLKYGKRLKMAAMFTQSAGEKLYEEENTDAHNQRHLLSFTLCEPKSVIPV